MAMTFFKVNSVTNKLVSKQARKIFKEGKKPILNSPFLTFLYEIYKNSLMLEIWKKSLNQRDN